MTTMMMMVVVVMVMVITMMKNDSNDDDDQTLRLESEWLCGLFCDRSTREPGRGPVTKWISQMAATKGNPQKDSKKEIKAVFSHSNIFTKIFMENIQGCYQRKP